MIEVQKLTKRYGPFTAVKDLEFSVDEGQILGFIGPNGAGKTTTMRILTGFIPATDGTARVAGFDVFQDAMEVKRNVGYLPETPPLYRELTVGAFLRFVAELRGLTGAAADRRIGEVMERVGLRGWERRITGSLSKGYRQRVGLAQALVHDPKVLILDEPTSGLDPAQMVGVRELMRDLAADHTVVVSTHILREVEALCSHVVVINEGEIAAKGSMEEVRQNAAPTHFRVELRDAEGAAVEIGALPDVRQVVPGEVLVVHADTDPRPAIARLAGKNDWTLVSLEKVVPSLEDAFLSLIGQEGGL
ncbi:MAG: ABC transporter ATP-binding protein [Proteobacteria bacterium]|nr:ABC transporter ATP-binding protein [Pseudomonadota bacterium]MCP4918090.1 ABC transporter ATP-binding protein [Pseudomonadota bacterium]